VKIILHEMLSDLQEGEAYCESENYAWDNEHKALINDQPYHIGFGQAYHPHYAQVKAFALYAKHK
jgi:hypothetical protein